MRLRSPEALWRCSRWLHKKRFPKLAKLVKTGNWMLHGCLLPAEASVGSGLILEHYAMGIVVHPQVKIGNNCRIYHHVTIAAESAIGSDIFVTIGNSVVIGVQSVIIGRPNVGLAIGDGAIVGAGAIVTRNVPAGEIWAGNPAKRIGYTDERLKRLGLV